MKLIFVYNANSGMLDRVIDNAHKMISPSTYDCNLCTITFGRFKEDELWKAFRNASEFDMTFYHKDEFESQLQSKWLPQYSFPIVLLENQQELEVFMSKEEINAMETSEELIEEIRKKAPHFI